MPKPRRPPIEADLRGRLCLVTGASSGIGLATARALAALRARVVLACRSRERGEKALQAVVTATGNREVELLLVDVAEAASVRAFARAFRERHQRLDVLVNNAGVWSTRRRAAPDGHELTWGTNALGYVRVADALGEPVARAHGRIVNVASRLAHSLDLDDVDFATRPYSGVGAYAQSKQANRMWTWALARRLEGSGVVVHAMHPGPVATPLFRKGGGLIGMAGGLWSLVFGRSPEDGADTVVWLAASDEAGAVSGRFWTDRRERPCRFRDPAAEDALYELCRDMTREAPVGAEASSAR